MFGKSLSRVITKANEFAIEPFHAFFIDRVFGFFSQSSLSQLERGVKV